MNKNSVILSIKNSMCKYLIQIREVAIFFFNQSRYFNILCANENALIFMQVLMCLNIRNLKIK